MEDRSPKTSLLRPQNRSERGTIEPEAANKMLSATTVRSDLEMEEGEERERESEDCILRERESERGFGNGGGLRREKREVGGFLK